MGGPSPVIRPEQRCLFVVPASVNRLSGEPLFTEGYLCVLRVGHPLLKGKLTVAGYAATRSKTATPGYTWFRALVHEAARALPVPVEPSA